MATASSTGPNNDTSSSDSDLEDYTDPRRGITGYQFEPVRVHSSRATVSPDESTSDSESDEGMEEGREGNTNWCQCTLCDYTTLSRVKEHKCCTEFPGMKAEIRSMDQLCITQNPSFAILCLHPDVLRNVLISLNSIRRDNWEIRPPTNRALRWATYKQFIWWIYGHLGRRIRRVIPACAVYKIRQRFPNNPEESYVPYASYSEDSD